MEVLAVAEIGTLMSLLTLDGGIVRRDNTR